MTMHYQVAIAGGGGSFQLGRISDQAAEYWSGRDNEELVAHISNPADRDYSPVDTSSSLPEWKQLGDLMSAYGFESIDSVVVTGTDGSVVSSHHDAQLHAAIGTEGVEAEVADEFWSHSGYKIFARSHEKGTCLFDLECIEPFDIKLLTLRQIEFWDHTLVSAVCYDGEQLAMTQGFDRSYANNEATLFPPAS